MPTADALFTADNPCRVLIVDDDRDFAESVEDCLVPAGFAVTMAHSAEAAHRAIAASRPHVAMLDIRLGVESGVDLLSAIRAQHPDIICVMMTARAEVESAIEAMRLGAYDYLHKGFHRDQLLALLKRCVDKLDLEERNRLALIKEREALDQARMANEVKTKFLATMSHELRTPLNAIIGFSDMIRSETYGPVGHERYREYIGYVHDSAGHLMQLVSTILDIAKSEAGKLILNEDMLAVAPLVERAVAAIRPRAASAGVNLSCRAAEQLPLLHADATKLKQILFNLLSNAIKFTDAGGSVEVTMDSREDGSFVIAVRDTGIGMADDEIPRALQPFEQIDNALSRRHEGSGLGLPLTAALMNLHQGQLTIESKPGGGTCVSAIFPASRVIWRATAAA